MRSTIPGLVLCLLLLGGCGGRVPDDIPEPNGPAGAPVVDLLPDPALPDGVMPEAAATPEEQDLDIQLLAPETSEEAPEPEPKTAPEPESLFEEMAGLFSFSSGAGAWSTELTVEADGSFSGLYVDSDMGSDGEGYPEGTRYVCAFSGKFTRPEQVNAYTWSMGIADITLENTPGETEYTDDVRCIYTGPYGLENAEELLVYLPGANAADLPEEFLSWAYTRWRGNEDGTLGRYAIFNVAEGLGFVGAARIE